MRFKFLLITVLLGSAACMAGNRENLDTISIRRAFIDLPVKDMDLLPRDTRLDMLDYFDADSLYMAPNSLKGASQIEVMTPDFLKIRLTPISKMVFKKLRMKDGSEIIMTLYTTGGDGDIRETDMKFYDSALNELPADRFFEAPVLQDFFNFKGDKEKKARIDKIMPFYTVAYKAEPASEVLSGKVTLEDVLLDENLQTLKKSLKPDLLWVWNGKRFIRK